MSKPLKPKKPVKKDKKTTRAATKPVTDPKTKLKKGVSLKKKEAKPVGLAKGQKPAKVERTQKGVTSKPAHKPGVKVGAAKPVVGRTAPAAKPAKLGAKPSPVGPAPVKKEVVPAKGTPAKAVSAKDVFHDRKEKRDADVEQKEDQKAELKKAKLIEASEALKAKKAKIKAEEVIQDVTPTDAELERLASDILGVDSATDDDVVPTDADGNPYCKFKDCDQLSKVDRYCRLHYLLLWKKIQLRKKILADGKLEKYIDDLTSRYPDKYIEMIRRDLKTEKDFLGAIQELEIDDSAIENEFDEESDNLMEEVRGMSRPTSGRDDDEF